MLCIVLFGVALTNIQYRPPSPLVDVYVSFEQTIETLRDKLQQSDFELCRVSFCCMVSCSIQDSGHAVLHVPFVWLLLLLRCLVVKLRLNAAVINVAVSPSIC